MNYSEHTEHGFKVGGDEDQLKDFVLLMREGAMAMGADLPNFLSDIVFTIEVDLGLIEKFQTQKVTPKTRAGKYGRDIICPSCKKWKTVYLWALQRRTGMFRWTRSKCKVCSRSFPHIVNAKFKPVTCGHFKCLQETIRKGMSTWRRKNEI